MKKLRKIGKALLAFFLLNSVAFATNYPIPPSNEALIGNVKYQSSTSGENVITVAKKYDLGFNALESSNPHLNMGRGFPTGSFVQLPTQHLLPDLGRRGIIINLPEMRMYYFPAGSNRVYTYPIGIGKIGKTIPIARTSITHKTKNPTWVPPEDIREFNLQQGVVLPSVMPPGPDNPLGPYAIYMRIPTYLIHSTIFPESIGRRASFGCIRMYENDIEAFFPTINSSIPVVIINSPIKVAWQNNRLYMEAHRPLQEHGTSFDTSSQGIVHIIDNSSKNQVTLVDWQLVSYLAKERDGMPHDIGFKVSQ